MRKNAAEHAINILQRGLAQVIFIGDCPQHPAGVHRSEIPQLNVSDAIADVMVPDFLVALDFFDELRERQTFLMGRLAPTRRSGRRRSNYSPRLFVVARRSLHHPIPKYLQYHCPIVSFRCLWCYNSSAIDPAESARRDVFRKGTSQ